MINKIISLAKKEVGVKENPSGSNKVKYNTEYYGKVVMGTAYPWCCAFIWWLFKECGASNLFYGGKKTASCTTLMTYYKSNGQFSQDPKIGSLAFFQFDKDAAADHIGIVVGVNTDGTVTTIEGNTSVGNDSNGGEVMLRKRKKSLIMGYAYPYETTKSVRSVVTVKLNVLRKGDNGKDVKALQILLNGLGYNCGTVDGDFGSNTLTAVKKFQTVNKLSVDGVVGAKTWESLLGV